MATDTLMPPAPAAPPAGVTIVDSGPPKPPPRPTTEIRVSALPKGDPTVSAPRPGSARSRMHDALNKKAGIEPEPARPKTSPEATSSRPEDENPPGEGGAADIQSPPSPSTEEAPPPAATGEATPPKAGGKVSPWKLFEAEKKARADVEKQLQEIKAQIVPEQERKTLEERVQRAEARAKEYEEHIRFVDYSKHPEFQEKYQKPYEAAWARAMSELKELTVGEPGSAGSRPITSEDMLELVQLPLQKARDIADQVFGKFADDVMAHRKEIKTLFEAQTNALAEARKNGSQRTQQQMEAVRQWQTETTTQIRQIWEKANAEALADPKHGDYFKPKEGDPAWNEQLDKGRDLVDKAFAVDPMNPKLSPADRAEAVRRHAAVRNRAMAYGPLRLENTKLKTELDTLKKELAKYKGATPPAGGRDGGNGPTPGPGRARDAMRAALEKYAH